MSTNKLIGLSGVKDYFSESVNSSRNFRKMSAFNGDSKPFRWNERNSKAAVTLALGYTQRETAEIVGITDRTIRLWYQHPEFQEEVDLLSNMVGVASRAERLRIAQAVVRQLVKQNPPTQKDLLDWLKFAQSETDGIYLGLAKIHDRYYTE